MAAALQKEQIAQIYKDFGLDELTIEIYGKIQQDVINPVLNELGITNIQTFKKFPNQGGSKNKKLLQILEKGQIGIDAINQSIIRERPTYTGFKPNKKTGNLDPKGWVAHIVKIAKPIKTVKLKPQEAIDKSKEILEEQIAGGSVKEVTEFIKDDPDTEIFVMDENPLSVAPKNAWDDIEYTIQTEIPDIKLEGVPFIRDSNDNLYQWQVGKPIYAEVSESDWAIIGYRPVSYKEALNDINKMLFVELGSGDEELDPESAEYYELVEQRSLIFKNQSKFKEREARPSIPAQSREEQLHEKYGKPYITKNEDWSSLTEEQITKIRKFRTSMFQGYKIKFGGDKQYLNYKEVQFYKLFDSGEGGQLSLSDLISSSSDDDIDFSGFNVDSSESDAEAQDEDEPAPEDKPVPVKKEKVKKEKVKKPKTPMLIQGQLFNIFSESESSESEDEALPQSVSVAPLSPIYKGPSKEEQLEQYLDNPGNLEPDDNIKLSDFSPGTEVEAFIPEDKIITNESELIDFKIYPDKPISDDEGEFWHGFNIDSESESDDPEEEEVDEDEPAPEVEQIVLTKPTILKEVTFKSEIIVNEDTSSEEEDYAFGDASTFKWVEGGDDSSDLSSESEVDEDEPAPEDNELFINKIIDSEEEEMITMDEETGEQVIESEIIVNEKPSQPADQSGVDDDSSDLSSLQSDSTSEEDESEEEGAFTGFDIGGDTDTSSDEELDKIVNKIEKTLPKPFL